MLLRRLLDANVLIAVLWNNHEHHERAVAWLRGVDAFATCPLTQLAFARISSHPQLGYALTPEGAFAVLRPFLADSRHLFVPDDLSSDDRELLTENIPGANQVNDHYLAALARRHGLVVATFDQTFGRAFPSEPTLIEVL